MFSNSPLGGFALQTFHQWIVFSDDVDRDQFGKKEKKVKQCKMAERKQNLSGDLHRDAYPSLDGFKSLKDSKQDDPPNSRLFIVCGKSVSEDDFREAFHKFGTIEEIWMVKDRTTGDPKGTKYFDTNLFGLTSSDG